MVSETLAEKLVSEIQKNPATFVAEQFKESGVFHSEAYGLDVCDLEDSPVIMRLTVGNNIYLNVTSWKLEDPYFKRIEYSAHAKISGSGECPEWVRDYIEHEGFRLFHGSWWGLERAIVGVAADEWREITVDITRCTPTPKYAWFFPCGLKPAMRRDGMFMHVNNQSESKET